MALSPGVQGLLPLLPRGGSALRLTALVADGKPVKVQYIAKIPNTEYDRDELGEEDDTRRTFVGAKAGAVLTLTFLKPLPTDDAGHIIPRGLVIYGRGAGTPPVGARWLSDAERGIRPWVWHAPMLVSGPNPVTVTLPPLSMRLTLLCGLLI